MPVVRETSQQRHKPSCVDMAIMGAKFGAMVGGTFGFLIGCFSALR